MMSGETKYSPFLDMEDLVKIGSQKLADLIGLKLLAVIEVKRQEESGLTMKLEFLEREGIPDTMDMVGLYEADFDPAGQLLNYSRVDMRKRGDCYN